ncbi:MAG: tRNA (N(6)-L-threonylcarbamoyladenosine(37)-C(2))-methylthiotransferase MtaB [Clostridia bacterium]|nr:tRNA (N(6)-L-threonylcarbamoyladenosine(37)-C(2))-methylthiotransferase MtaB [Clostridia bacterium]
MKVSITTLGCKVNQYESEAIAKIFKSKGYEVLPSNNPVDIIIVNSCTVTAESSRKTRQTVRRLKKKNPQAITVLTGCMVQAFRDEAEAIDEVDIIIGNTELAKILDACEQFLTKRQRISSVVPHKSSEKYEELKIDSFSEHTRAYMKIEDGCNRFCSYCIIPYARGRVRSRSLDEIKNEAERLGRAGYKEIVLVGINLSAFGQDTGYTLYDAVEAVAHCGDIKRIRLGSLECDMMSDEILSRLASCEKFCPQFHLSLQSGCDGTLDRMNRKYDTLFYKDMVERIRRIFPNPSITTDILVGFAGESDDEFSETCEFIKGIGYARAHVFVYSRRKGTKAADFENQVAPSIKQQRAKTMTCICKAAEQDFLDGQLGLKSSVLFETQEGEYWTGYTENYTRVYVQSDEINEGDIKEVKLIEKSGDNLIGILK